ncbi:MAG TPA: hypothetical protein VHB18_07840 [Mycobacteriales bacterium]|jgi:hypothetical protein|nr:hypothetical protein [Mycobacteriales bacterium]
MNSESRECLLSSWAIVSAYSGDTTTPAERVCVIDGVIEDHGAVETAGALGFLAGSVLLPGLAEQMGVTIEQARQQLGTVLSRALESLE